MNLIAYLATPGGLTGAPKRLLALAKALSETGMTVSIIAPANSELLEAAEHQGHRTIELDTAGRLGLRRGAVFSSGAWFRLKLIADLLRQNLRLLHCIRRNRGDAFWVRGSKGIAFGALGSMLSRKPLIWDVDFELPSVGLVRWLHRVGIWVSEVVIFQYRGAPDQILGPELAARYRHKFRAIVPGIDLSALRALSQRRRMKNTQSDAPFVLLQVGTICARKNQALTIEALRLAQDRGFGPWELWLTYDEIQETEFEAHLRTSGLDTNVKLLGWRNDVQELMVQADLLLMPSKDEGVPNAVQEAMAIGLPVLVSGAGGMPEIVSAGETGWILDLDDPAAWADRISWCREHPSATEQIGLNASEYAFNHFGTERWGTEYARAIRDSATMPTHGRIR